METRNLDKTKKIASIVSIVLVIVLVASIFISSNMKYKLLKDSVTIELGTVSELSLQAEDFFKVEEDVKKDITFDVSEVDVTKVGTYNAYAHLNDKEYTIEVIVEDTKAPKASFNERCIFTNDIAGLEDYSAMIASVEEASEYTTKLIRFEKEEDLCEVNDKKMENLLKNIGGDASEKADVLGTEEIPTKEGIYRSILALEDAQGNVSYEEVYVILDTTGALIDEVEDLEVYVNSKSKLKNEPELDMSKYKAHDNVDGALNSDDLTIELVKREEGENQWITHVSYTDRAGNESHGEFLITVKVKASATASNANTGTSAGGSTTGTAGSTVTPSQPVTSHDPADTNGDGVVDMEEGNAYMSPEKQACLDAGLGVVVPVSGGYMVAVSADNYTAGPEILRSYLASQGLSGTVGCHSGNSNYDWFIAYNITQNTAPTPEDPGFWQ